MFNDLISGGQVFLHKIRMLKQVIISITLFSLLAGTATIITLQPKPHRNIDWDGATTYTKASWAMKFHPALSAIAMGGPRPAVIDAYSQGRLWQKNMLAVSVLRSHRFHHAFVSAVAFVKIRAIQSLICSLGIGLMIFLIWSRFGSALKQETSKEGSSVLLTAKEVAYKLKALKKASDFHIGQMPLVKDMETRHILVTGSTGSGKTNLLHNLLPQVRKKNQSAVVLDQTGEMISKYYDPNRGDIIFNPFDSRSHMWDFWSDCAKSDDMERFAKIVMGYQRNRAGSKNDPFWENSAEIVFTACAQYIKKQGGNLTQLMYFLEDANLEHLKKMLSDTPAKRHISTADQTIASILTVLATNTKPLGYLATLSRQDRPIFSLRNFVRQIQQPRQQGAWLFLATKPDSRELTLPLLASMAELSMAELMALPIDHHKRLWFVIDELASLKKLPALESIMAEGRKYGACVVASMQSLNQLYEHYGHYLGSAIFGQFGTSFFFRNSEPTIGKLLSDMSGQQILQSHQKNTSFGANEFRDGVSYNEQEKRRALVEPSQLASLNVGECFVVLPEVQTRLAKIQTEEAAASEKLQNSFIEFEIDEQEDEAKRSFLQDTVKSKKEHKTLKQATAPEPDIEVRPGEKQLAPPDHPPLPL